MVQELVDVCALQGWSTHVWSPPMGTAITVHTEDHAISPLIVYAMQG